MKGIAMKAYMRLASGTVLETDNPAIWPEGERLSAKVGKDTLKAEALEQLRKVLKPGDTVYTVLRHVSSSGMSRDISVHAIKDNQPVWLTGYAARVLGWSMNKAGDALKVSGAGMDMGFHVVYTLSAVLFPKGTAGKPDGGYALEHRWL